MKKMQNLTTSQFLEVIPTVKCKTEENIVPNEHSLPTCRKKKIKHPMNKVHSPTLLKNRNTVVGKHSGIKGAKLEDKFLFQILAAFHCTSM